MKYHQTKQNMSSKNSTVPAREREFTSEEERTIERSKQVIDLATTIASGDQPSNVQLKKAIAAGKAGLEEAKQKTELQGTLYPEGEAFVTDAKALLTDAQLLLDEKNRDGKFQKFASDAQNLIDLLKAQAPAVGAQVQLAVESREPKFTEKFEEFLPEQRELMQQVVMHLRVLLSTTVRSGEFRSLVVDTMDLMRSLFIGGTEQLQQTVDSKLAQMQQNFQKQQPLTSQTLPSQTDVPSLLAAPATGSQNVQFTPAVQQAHLASTSLSGIQQPTASLSLQGPQSGYYKDMYGTSKTFAYSSMKQDFRYETKKIVDQFLDILGRYTHQKEFAEALKAEIDLLSAFQSTLKREAEQVAESVKSSTRNIWASRQFQLVYTDAVNNIEAFTGANTWSPFWKSLTRWLDFIQNDTRTRTYFYEWKTCFYEALDDPQKLSQQQFHNRLVDLIDRGRSLSYELKWSTYTQDIFKLALEMIDNVVNDPLLTRISQDTQKLMANLVTNEQGNLAFKPELMQQINEIFVTLFTQQMQFIPISEIRDVADGTLGKYDYILKNIVFRAEDILPEHMHIRTTNDVDFNVKSFTTNSAKTDIYIKIDQIKFHLHNVEFWYKRLSTPKMEDSGFVDVDMAGDGAEIVVHVIVNPPSQQPIFDVQKIQCTIHDLSLKTKESKHDTMYSVVSGLFAGTLKRYIQDKVESELTRNIAILNNKLNQLIEVLPQQESLSSLVTQQVKAVIGLEPSAAEQPRKAPSAVV